MTTKSEEGNGPFHGHRTWYRIVGEEGEVRCPRLVLPGGPGTAPDHLGPLEDIAATGRRVIFYDQLRCGLSDPIDYPDLWTVQLFIDELRAVRDTWSWTGCASSGSRGAAC